MAKARKSDLSKAPTFVQEILAVLGAFFALFFFLALVSYNGDMEEGIYGGNWCGVIGFFIAHSLLGMLGISSYVVIGLVLFFSWKYFFSNNFFERIPHIILGSTGILLGCSSLVASIHAGEVVVLGRSLPGSGVVGATIFGIVYPFLGRPGFILFFLMIMLLSMMIAIPLSPYVVFQKGIGLFQFIWGRMVQRLQQPPTKVNLRKNKIKEYIEEKEGTLVPMVHEPPKVHEPPATIEKESSENFQPLPVAAGDFRLPSVQLLQKSPIVVNEKVEKEYFLKVSKKLEDKLQNFGVKGQVIGISPGPVVTTYEFAPAPGVKISKVVSLEDDLALGLKTESVRIIGSVPGKAALGIEIPNPKRLNVYIRDILATELFQKTSSPLTIGLGKDVVGNPVLANLAEMPHLLIAGATGAGKSVGINTIICSILLKASPEEVRLLMVDPKRIELSMYENIPHLLHPVVVDPKMASRALEWAVREMERRYGLMEQTRVKNITSYNKQAEEKLPFIVIIIDELADLMMVASKDVENSVARLAQMARAAGMHLILATQRPSVDVLTGLIKANFPTRLSFKVSSKIDSRTILDAGGAERLLGKGDMLFIPPGTARMKRIHGAFISEPEIDEIVNFLKEQRTAAYDESALKIAEEPDQEKEQKAEEYDEKYDEAVALVCETGQASISMVQRRLRVGYNRAARMIEIMEREGVVGPADGSKPREVLARKKY